MNRHKIRENLVFSVYQHLLLKNDLNSMICNNFEVESILECDPYLIELANVINLNEVQYIANISQYLIKWHFDRLNYVDQAILLVGCAELDLAKIDKAIIIDEAINLAKEYCDDDSFKYINGVLDQL